MAQVTLDLEDVEWLLGEARGAFRQLQGHLGACIPSIGSSDARRISEIEMEVEKQVRTSHEQRSGASTSGAIDPRHN